MQTRRVRIMVVCAGTAIVVLLSVIGWHGFRWTPAVKGLRVGVHADAPWPMFGGNARRTGQSPFETPGSARLQWRVRTHRPISASSVIGAASSPVIGADGTIYIGSDDDCLYALGADGTQKWKLHVGDIAGGCSAIGEDGTIYSQDATGGYMCAINPNGTLKWKYQLLNSLSARPVIADGGGVISSSIAYLYALHPDGQLVWKQHALRDNSDPSIGHNGIIYIVSRSRECFLCAFRNDGMPMWSTRIDLSVSPPSIGNDGMIYVAAGSLYAIGADGSIRWTFDRAWCLGSPAISTEGTIFVGSYDRNLYAVREDGALRWKFKTNGLVRSTPAISANGIVYVGSDDGYLYAIDLSGFLRWKYKTGGKVSGSPAIGSDGTVYVGSEDGYLYAFGK